MKVRKALTTVEVTLKAELAEDQDGSASESLKDLTLFANRGAAKRREWKRVVRDFFCFFRIFANFRGFREFFEVFRLARTCSDLFGSIQMHSDAFGCIWMRSDASGPCWKIL